jgi:hypothetical protein
MISVGTEYYGERMAAREQVLRGFFLYLRIFPGTLLLAEFGLQSFKSNSYSYSYYCIVWSVGDVRVQYYHRSTARRSTDRIR